MELEIRDDDPIIDAKRGIRMTLLYFSDVGCPNCALFERLLEDEIKPAFNGHLRIVFKHFPPRGKPSMKAARAMEAARLQGKFWEMQHELVARRRELANLDYPALAGELDLDVERFKADMTSKAVQDRIDADIAHGRDLGVHSTPTAFLNRRHLDRLMRGIPAFWHQRAVGLRRQRAAQGQDW
jgi:protein-disulfide isomerase